MTIKLKEIITVNEPAEYKMHLACWNEQDQPLDVYVRDPQEWEMWNSWRGKRNDFSRDYIFSFIDFYHEPDTWLFGGIYKVLSRSLENNSNSYEIAKDKDSEKFIGRVKVRFKRPSRYKAPYLENYYDDLIVSEILKGPYNGESFCGYEEINHDFSALEAIFKNNRKDWKAALENVKGVYLIVDRKNGKKYVGSAYGETGIWSRWACYMETGHGFNNELTQIIKDKGIEYARENFRLSLLEYRPMKTDDYTIIQRENYWKEALLTRGEYGYNQN